MKLLTLLFLTLISFTASAQVPDGIYLRLIEAEEQGDCRQILRITKSALEDYPDDYDLLRLRSNCLLTLNHLAEAADVYSKLIELFPDSSRFYINRASAYTNLGLYDEAISDYNMALEHAESDADRLPAYASRGSLQIFTRDFEGAQLSLDSAYAIDSNDLVTMNSLGLLYMEVKDYEQALDVLWKITEHHENFGTSAYSNIGFVYQDMGEHEKAIEAFNKVLEDDPNMPFALSNRAYSELQLGQKKKALKDVNRSLEFYPSNSYAYRNRALIYLAMDEPEKACADIAAALHYEFTTNYGDEVLELQKEHCR